MQVFPATFLLLLQQLALGGLFALAVPPFHEMERGFYKSTAAVLFAAALLGLWGKADLYWRVLLARQKIPATVEMALYACFVIFFALYLFSLWGERVRLRARAFSSSLLIGLLGLTFSSFAFREAPFWSVETVLFPVGFLLSALLLGAATVGMLLGHWYLIDAGQSIEPFRRIFGFFVSLLVIQALYFALLPLTLYLFGSQEALSALRRLWEEHPFLLSARILVTQAGPLILCYMIRETLKIPNTMAATGLFYIALLGVFVGEILGRHLLALASLPL